MDKIQKTEIVTASAKLLLGAIPYVGPTLNEIIFDYRNGVKQERLNNFTLLLSEFFVANPEVDLSNLKNEEFSDLFESVLNRVSQTKSSEKHKRFRDILTLHIQNPELGTDNSEIYLDLVSSLNEMSIRILKEHQYFKRKYDSIIPLKNALEEEIKIKQPELNKVYAQATIEKIMDNDIKKEISDLQQQVDNYAEQIRELQLFRKATFHGLSEDEFLYYKQILLSKGLLVDSGVGSIGHVPFLYMSITEFGNKFIEFLLTD